MASACLDNNAAMPTPEPFLDCPSPAFSYAWLSPRVSFSRDFANDEGSSKIEILDQDVAGKDFLEFEFRLDDPVTMLPADELFSDGKLVPLHMATARPSPEIRSPEPVRSRRRMEFSGSEPYAISPRAPRCSSRWRELLGLKRQQNPRPEPQIKVAAIAKSSNPKSLKSFLQRNPRSARIEASLSLPLLRDSDSEVMSFSSRRSLSSSSSSSGPDHDDFPRLSLDSEKPGHAPIRNPSRVRVSRHASAAASRRSPEAMAVRGASVDSPRMIASGRVVFQGLERSSSSPGSFIGGPRPRMRGMERSYSTNVRVTPVLNVPVCSLRGSVFGLGHIFSPQKKDRDGAGRSLAGAGNGKVNIDKTSQRD